MIKGLTSIFMAYSKRQDTGRNLRILARFIVVLIALVTVDSVLFHFLMAREGQHFTWITGFYWTLTVMSTLGFGDITFHTDAGRLFSIVVLLTGMVFMLTLLPFTFIQFFYAPWMEAQKDSRIRRRLPPTICGHVLLTHDDEVTRSLIYKLDQYQVPYALIIPDLPTAMALNEEGLNILVGELNDPETYRNAQVHQAALVAATGADIVNTTIASTVRGLTETVQIVAKATDEHSVDILELAGCNHVLRLSQLMGSTLSRRIIAGDAMTHVVGRFDQLLVAEASAANTPLVGKTLRESKLREHINLNVLGVWERGKFIEATSDTLIHQNSILVLAGSRAHLDEYDELFCIYNVSSKPVVIIGGGRVGRAAGAALGNRNIDYRIIEPLGDRVRDNKHYVHGSAANIDVLKASGFMESPAVAITTHDDDLNIYLTIYCRQLRPDIQITSRITQEHNVTTLHRVGADFVMSYAAMGANTIFNLLKRGNVLMVAEGLDIFRMKTPKSIVGKTMAELAIRRETGCSIMAYKSNGDMHINPDPFIPIPENSEIIVVGNVKAEDTFLKRYCHAGQTA